MTEQSTTSETINNVGLNLIHWLSDPYFKSEDSVFPFSIN